MTEKEIDELFDHILVLGALEDNIYGVVMWEMTFRKFLPEALSCLGIDTGLDNNDPIFMKIMTRWKRWYPKNYEHMYDKTWI